MSNGYVFLADGASDARGVSAPASGATITLWDGENEQDTTKKGADFKRLLVALYASHASGTLGLVVNVKLNKGGTYRTLASFTVPAATLFSRSIELPPCYAAQVKYTNSANTLTTWEMRVSGDRDDRSPGS